MLLILFGIFFLAMLINIPIAFCMGLGVTVAMILTTNLPITLIPIKMYSTLNSFPLLAIPLYIMAGSLMNKSGITMRLINFAKTIIGFSKGGLGMAAVLASMFFGGVSGSSVADTAAIGNVLFPEMKKEGYDENFSTALFASAGTLGGIIPPSIAMVLYGVVSGTSIAKLFLAGAIPGILLGISFMFVVHKSNYPAGPKPSLLNIIKGFNKAILPLGMPAIIVGGIYGGIFTATEAGMIAVIYALIVGMFVYRTIKLKDIFETIIETGVLSGIPCLTIAYSGSLAFLSSYANIPKTLSMAIYSITSNEIIIMILINLMLLIIGMFMDGAAVYPIVVPILLPLLIQMGISPLHFGVIIVLNLSIGLITPPVGQTLFTACAVTKTEPFNVARKAIPFIFIAIVILMLVTYVPWFSEFLPNLMTR